MADISKELEQIMRAQYGRDVRQSIHDGIQSLNISLERERQAAEAAQRASETAQGKAESAQEKAETAQGKAESAQEKAETAQGKAESAQEKAETAQGKAESAQEKAETAQGKTQEVLENLKKSTVTGVKGCMELTFRRGDVDLTAENIGAACSKKSIIDLSDARYDQNTWYPATGTELPRTGLHRINLAVQLNSGTVPDWSEHWEGFSCNMDIWTIASGWGATHANTFCAVYDYSYCGSNAPHGYSQMINSSTPILWLRGGGRYFVWTDYNCEWVPQTSEYAVNGQSVSPATSGAVFDLGYCSKIHADLQGTARNALHDGNGNNIAETYIKKTEELSNNLNFAEGYGIHSTVGVNDFWRIIGGCTEPNKGFLEIATADDSTEPIYVRQYRDNFNNAEREICLLNENGESVFGNVVAEVLYFGGKSNYYNSIDANDITTSSRDYNIWIEGDNAPQTQLQFKSENTHAELTMDPWGSRDVNLGSTDYRWDNIYATNGTIQTSDRNEKNGIEELDSEKAQTLIYGLKPSTYRMNAGTSGRTHWGMISQDIEELFEEIGMTSLDFAGFIKSPKVQEGEYDYSLRYDEFIAPIIKVIQSQHEEIETLKKEIEMLEHNISFDLKEDTL